MAEIRKYQQANVQAGRAGGQAGTAGMLASAQAKTGLASKLSQFFSQMTSLAGDMAHVQASKDAVRDTFEYKKKVAQTRDNPNLTEEQRNEEVSKLNDNFYAKGFGVYSKAYNTTADAAYANQVTVDAKDASFKAIQLSNGDPDIYKEAFRKYQDETVLNAPSRESKIVAQQAISKYGAEGYKKLWGDKVAKDYRVNGQKFAAASKLQSEDYLQSVARGDFTQATIDMEKLVTTTSAGERDGYTTNDEMVLEYKRLTEKGIMQYATDRFKRGEEVDASQYIQDFRDGKTPAGGMQVEFEEEERNKIADRMEYVLDTELKRRDATDKAIIKERKENSDLMVKDAIAVYKSGKIPDNIDEVIANAEYASPTKQHDLRIQARAAEVVRPYSKMSLPEQLTLVSAMEAEETANIEDVTVLATVKQNLKEKLALAKRDMITLGAQDGLYEPTMPVVPGMDTDTSMAIISERLRQSNIAKEKYGTPNQVFTEVEATQWADWISDSGTSIDDKMAFIESIDVSTNGKGHIAYRQLMKDKRASVFTAAGDFFAEGRPNISKMLLHGEMVLSSEMGASIDRKELTGVLNSTLGNTLARSTKDDKDKVIRSTMAYYASLAEGYGSLGDQSYKYADQAVEEVLGKQGIRNGQGYFAPQGMDADDVDDFIDEIDVNALDMMQGIPKEGMKDVIDKSKLIQVQGNKYRLIFQNHSVTKEDGTPYILEIMK